MKFRSAQQAIGVAVLALFALGTPVVSSAEVLVTVTVPPPPLPVYAQPLAPAPGFLWTPGYWAYGVDGYYWVPGTWVAAPYVGALWTPGYWAWGSGAYIWHRGYWGPRVGFYGGVNYGYGYSGVGYVGGRWNNGVFSYNTAVNNVNVTKVHNTYNETIVNRGGSRVSYNGGTGGIGAQPTADERLAEHDEHRQATQRQMRHEQSAINDRAQLASANHGTPAVTAVRRPAEYKTQGGTRNNAGGGQREHTYAGAGTAHVQGEPNAAHRNPHPHADAPAQKEGHANEGHGGHEGGDHH